MSTNASGNTGPPGQPRGVGFGIFLFIITLGLYGLYWVYKSQEEMKTHRRRPRWVLGLVIWIVIGAVSAFVIPSEIGTMYKKDGSSRRSPAGRDCGFFRSGSFSFPRSSGS